MKKTAVVAGHICIDITPVIPKTERAVRSLGDLLRPGKLIHTLAPDVHTGGTVANTGLAMKILGAKVHLVGKVGDDAFGGMVRKIMEEYGAGDDLAVSPGDTTSYSVVISVPGIDRVFLHCPGANDSFDGSEISDEILSDAALFHFGYPPIMGKMFAEEGKYLAQMFRRVSGLGIATSLDMAAIDPESPAGKADWEKILSRVLPYVDFFVPSVEELCFMLDRERYDRLQKKAQDTDMTKLLSVEEDIRPLAEKCLEMGTRAVLLKCGERGLFLLTSGSMHNTGSRLGLCAADWNDFCHFEPSYRVEHVLSGTGAGDTCIAAFLTSILEGAGPACALENAAAAGALCCTSYDAISALVPLSKIRERIEEGWSKNS